MQTECVIPQLKELEQLKLSPSTKSAAADKFITKKYKTKTNKTKKQCQRLRLLWPASNIHILPKLFCCKIEIVEKLKWLFSSWCDKHNIFVKICEKQLILLCQNY